MPDIDFDESEKLWTAELFDGTVVRCPTWLGMETFLNFIEARYDALEKVRKRKARIECPKRKSTESRN